LRESKKIIFMTKNYFLKNLGLLATFLMCSSMNAQFSQNFDASTSLPTGWSVINGGDANTFTVGPASTGSAFSQPNSVYIAYSATAHNDYLVTPLINVTAGVNDRLTYYVKNQDPLYVENYDVRISTTTATAAAFTTTVVANGPAPSTWTQMTIDLRPYIGSSVYVGFHATSTDMFRLHFDDIVSDTFPLVAPGCTNFTSPTSSATVNAGLTTVTWAAATGASGYKLTIGTTSGGTDVFNNTVSGTSQSLSLPANKTLYAKIVPTNNIGDATGCTEIMFNTNSTFNYCTAGSTSTSLEKISNVTFSNINNNSTSTGGYEDFSSVTGNVTQGLTYPFSASFTGTSYDSDQVIVWIDFNQDGDFTDVGEQVLITTPAKSPWTGNITIPAGALTGTTKMRVRLHDSSLGPNLTPCGTSSYGQVEDYTINITAAVACTGAPSIDSVTSSATSVCAGTPFTLDATVSPLAAYSYQWQSSTDNDTWTNLGSAQIAAQYNVSGITATTYYRLVVTCTATSQSTTSAVVTVTKKAVNECYCTNAINFVCSEGDVIQNVTFGGINNDSQCGDTTTGYSNYTTSVAAANVFTGTNVSFSVKVGPSGDGWLYESVGVWIDYNQNGIFDTNEYTFIGTGLDQVLTKDIAIPTGALVGNTRMRVVVAASQESAFTDAYKCGPLAANNPYGEMEDYTINIGTLAVSETSKSNIKAYPNPVKDIFTIEAQGKIKSVKVFDVTGKQLLTKDLNEATSKIDFTKFNSGVYVVTTTMEDGSTSSTKVIKK